jgi:hypothetical protein
MEPIFYDSFLGQKVILFKDRLIIKSFGREKGIALSQIASVEKTYSSLKIETTGGKRHKVSINDKKRLDDLKDLIIRSQAKEISEEEYRSLSEGAKRGSGGQYKEIGYLVMVVAVIMLAFSFIAAVVIALSSIVLFPWFEEKVKKGWSKELPSWLRLAVPTLVTVFAIVMVASGPTDVPDAQPTITAEQMQAQTAEQEKEQKRLAAEKAEFEKTPAGKICKAHLTWVAEECKAVAEKKIWIGMHYDMLVYNLGNPAHTNVSNYGSGSQYQWCWNDYTPSCFYDSDNDKRVDSYN